MIDPALRQALADALRGRLAVITDHALRERDPAAQLAQLQAASEKITALHQRLPAGAPARLRHFLESCSYDKALAFLESEG